MSHNYQAVGWNRQKKIYDTVLLGGVVLYLVTFIVLNLVLRSNITIETLIIRAFGTAALLLLHILLSIGPLCRLDSRFLPLLYNRRHMGVTLFVLAATHGVFAIIQFHALGDLNPIVSVLVGNDQIGRLSSFPFQPFGLVALVILFLMAATSHDFWLTNLTAPVWKALHMMVYIAYGLLIAHVSLGILQAETNPLLAIVLGVGFSWVLGLHLISGFRERICDQPIPIDNDSWVVACSVDDIPDNHARVVHLSGERIAVFRYGNKISAISSVCQHQNGPLGEGCILQGLVTCPWHGYQYDPETGASPPPFEERVPTFNVRVDDGQVWLDPKPNPPGTRVEAAIINSNDEESKA